MISNPTDKVKVWDGTEQLEITAGNAAKVDGSAVTQPVSAASLPLPSGASTSAKQDLLLAELQLKADLTETQPVSAASLPLPSGAATSAKQDLLLTELQLKADLTETQPVSAASLPLPSGAATNAKLDELKALVGEVQASPTDNTVLDRLKDLLTGIILAAGTNAIGKLAANSGVDIGDVDVTSLPSDLVFTDDAAFTVGTSKVLAIGFNTVAHGSNPDTADAGDIGIGIANRHRIPFTLGGHPNIVGLEYMTTGAQTNDAIIDSISAGTKIVVTSIDATLDGDTTVTVKVRIGFGASAVPTEPTTGNSVTGMVLSHPDMKAGSGLVKGDGSGIVGIGGDGEELRITCEAPTSGQLTVMVHYFTIAS